MSYDDTQLRKQQNPTHNVLAKVLGMAVLSVLSLSGCVTESEVKQDMNQEQLGLGIVVGTLGYQEIQKELAPPGAFSLVLEGQVVKIEGAAYVVKDITKQEHRIPFDQNTTIDRPAHIGDWVAGYFDSRGRAIHIRNIDEEFMARDAPLELE